MNNPLLFFLCSIGVFNGFLASIYFLFFSKQKRVQNFFFGLLLLLLSIRIGKSVYTIFTIREERNLWILQIGLSACFLIGIAVYYYVKSSVENTKVIPRSWKIHIAILLIFIVIVGSIKPYATNHYFWTTYFVQFIYATWAVYLLFSVYLLKDILKKLFQKNVRCTISEIWLVALTVANILIFTAYIIGYFYLYFVGTITFSVVFYVLLIFLLFEKNRDSIFQDIPEKYQAKKIDTTEEEQLISALKEAMETHQFHKNTNVKLNDIAKVLHISSHKLSQLLNDNLGKNFALFINEYRVTEAKRLLQENNQFTLESIGFEAGFSSKSTFYATFKKLIGKTPAEFKKQFS
ncbi:AraC family transcriptional regulator [Kordia sp. YSTF-M3]|uniref:AraC family transcriptional regulator n=1 Tax=Kordia aestuariivivens TaxID=2759037 RepID=A0ABR7Q9L2_9FLAO|nr:helix-turn-helix domain-containing protein [Kordia aestuariivivens]MBC8755046.1 AraC family transcriptional regulator [Kordia aestuariivivens]